MASSSSSRQQTSTTTATTIGRSRNCYEFESLLGEGALGRVYLARNIKTNCHVAIKIIQKSHIRDRRLLALVLSERNVLSSLSSHHPNLISLLCTFQDDAYLYFVLDYVPGGSLSDLFNRYRGGDRCLNELNQSLIKYWTGDILNMLVYLKSKNVVHQDIKPDNLLLDNFNRLRLIDFNNARIVDHNRSGAKPSSKETESGVVPANKQTENTKVEVGTLAYLPPEVMIQTAPKLFGNDRRFMEAFAKWSGANKQRFAETSSNGSEFAVDIWAGGCVIFELLCGFHPFRGGSDIETALNVLKAHTMILPDSVPTFFVPLLSSMLAPVPENRLDLDKLSQFPLFRKGGELDLQRILLDLDRPKLVFQTTKSSVGVQLDDVYEFTPELGSSFKSMALDSFSREGLILDEMSNGATQWESHHQKSAGSRMMYYSDRDRGYSGSKGELPTSFQENDGYKDSWKVCDDVSNNRSEGRETDAATNTSYEWDRLAATGDASLLGNGKLKPIKDNSINGDGGRDGMKSGIGNNSGIKQKRDIQEKKGGLSAASSRCVVDDTKIMPCPDTPKQKPQQRINCEQK